MSVEADIFTALKGLVANRVYPDVAPDAVLRPFIVYQQVGGTAVNFVEPAVPGKKNGRFQVSVWADTRSAAATLARQVEDTLRVVPDLQTTVLGAPMAVYEEDTKLRGSMQDFSFWFNT
jgi:hypothetical protein